MKTCVFAGTFDPFTVGHKHMVDECLTKFDRVIVVIGDNPKKSSVMPYDDRKLAVESCYKSDERVVVVCYQQIKDNFSSFLLDLGATVYVRGIRNDVDMQFEKQMEQKNRKLYPFIKTEYVFADDKHKNISSTLVRENIIKGQSIKGLVPDECVDIVLKSFGKN